MRVRAVFSGTMGARVVFRYLPVDDVVVATPHGALQSAADVAEWSAQFAPYFSRFDRKMDLVAVLDDFTITAAVAEAFGQARAQMHQRFTRFSCRVGTSARLRQYHQTSGVRFDAPTEEAASLEDGIASIRAQRARAKEQESTLTSSSRWRVTKSST